MDIDEAIDRVETRIRRAGASMPGPVSDAEVARVEAELAPLRLPDEYRRLLERLGPPTRLVGFAPLQGVEFALDSWCRDRELGFIPRVLFTIGYTSHTWLAVELASGSSPGGELYYWGPGDDFFHLNGRLPGYLAALAEAPAERPVDQYGQLLLHFDVDELRSGQSVGHLVETWPEHWQRAEGFGLGDFEALGATATVSEVLASRERGPVQERIHVRIAAVTATYRESFVTVADPTGSMVLRWPGNIGPTKAQRDTEVELEIRSDPSMRSRTDEPAETERVHREVKRQALQGDLEDVQIAAARLIEGIHDQGVDGEVTEVRLLSEPAKDTWG